MAQLKRKDKNFGGGILRNYSALILLVLLLVGAGLFTPNFLSVITINNIIMQSASTVLIAFGLTIVISSGNIDISVGSLIALAGMVFALLIEAGVNIFIAILITMAVGAVCGLFSGYIVSKFGVLPMVMTMSMMYMLRGIARVLTNGSPKFIQDKELTALSYYKIFGFIPTQLVLIAAVFLLVYLLVRRTRFGLLVEACGDNVRAARTAGINTVLVLTACYVISGIMAALGGVTEAIMAFGADPGNLGLNFEGDAIAATVIGGTPMSGGRPNLLGTLCGAFILTMIKIIVNMNNIPFAFSNVIRGIIIVVAVYVQSLQAAGRKT